MQKVANIEKDTNIENLQNLQNFTKFKSNLQN